MADIEQLKQEIIQTHLQKRELVCKLTNNPMFSELLDIVATENKTLPPDSVIAIDVRFLDVLLTIAQLDIAIFKMEELYVQITGSEPDITAN